MARKGDMLREAGVESMKELPDRAAAQARHMQAVAQSRAGVTDAEGNLVDQTEPVQLMVPEPTPEERAQLAATLAEIERIKAERASQQVDQIIGLLRLIELMQARQGTLDRRTLLRARAMVAYLNADSDVAP